MNTQKRLYTKDKKVKITFRCEDALGDWLSASAAVVGLTPSAFVRQMLYQQMYAEKTISNKLDEIKTSTETAVLCKQAN